MYKTVLYLYLNIPGVQKISMFDGLVKSNKNVFLIIIFDLLDRGKANLNLRYQFLFFDTSYVRLSHCAITGHYCAQIFIKCVDSLTLRDSSY